MDTELDNKINELFEKSIEVVKFISKDDKFKYYEMKDGTKIATENDDCEEKEEKITKVKIDKKKKRVQSEGNKKWWEFVKEFEKRPEMAGKSRNFIVQAAKKPYHESKNK